MLRSSLYDYSHAYIFVKGNISFNKAAAAPAVPNNRNKNVIFKNPAPFTDCITKINNTQADNSKDIDLVMPMYIAIIIQKHLEDYGGNIVMIYPL